MYMYVYTGVTRRGIQLSVLSRASDDHVSGVPVGVVDGVWTLFLTGKLCTGKESTRQLTGSS